MKSISSSTGHKTHRTKKSTRFIKWLPFIGLSIIYMVSSLSVSYDRYLYFVPPKRGCDYTLHIKLCDTVSRGINPYSVWLHRFNGYEIFPHSYCHYAGSSVFDAIVLWISGASPKVVVTVISPMLANIFMLLAVCAVCRIMNFNPNQSFFFLLFFCFLNDQMLNKIAYGDGELIGAALGLVGLGYYLKKKYILAIPWIGVSSWLHLANIAYFAILVTWFLLFGGYILIKNKFQVRGLLNKISFRNVYVRQALSLLAMGIIIGAYLVPIFQQKTVYWYDKPEPVDPTDPTDPIDPIDPIDPGKPNPHQYVSSSRWGVISKAGGRNTDKWVLPQRLTDWALVVAYPLTYIYSSFFPRSTLGSTLRLFGYNLTSTDLELIRSFSLNTPVFVAAVPIIYGLGFPLLFVIALWECVKSQDTERKLLYISAYLLIIFLAAGYSIFGIAIFSQRYVRYTACFWVFALIPSEFINPNSRIKKIGLYSFSLFLVVRFIIYFMGIIH